MHDMERSDQSPNCFPVTLPSRADHTRLLPDQSKQLTDQSTLFAYGNTIYI